jgi:hypothetical protein
VASVILKSIFRGVLKIDDGIQALEAVVEVHTPQTDVHLVQK